MTDLERLQIAHGEVYLSSKDVRAKYGNVSAMTIIRWIKNGRLPKPIKFNGSKRNLWPLSELIEKERAATRDRVAA